MSDTVLLHITAGEDSYLPILKGILKGRLTVKLSNKVPTGFYDMVIDAKRVGATRIATTSPKLLSYLLGVPKKLPSTDDYAGSIIEKAGMEFLILPPLEQLVTVPYGKFLATRFWKKYYDPSDWLSLPKFSWELFVPENFESLLSVCNNATFIAVDIETAVDDPERVINCCGFTAVRLDDLSKTFSVRTVVIPFTSLFNIAAARQLLGTKAPKVLQNGKYDVAYLLRWNAPPTNWAFDTIQLFHSWYSECSPRQLDEFNTENSGRSLKKSLGFLASFMLRKWVFWKDEGKTGDLLEYYQYNAKDCFATAMVLLALLQEMPPWAIENFKMEFPLNFPCVLAEATGILADTEQMEKLSKNLDEVLDQRLVALRKMVACPYYNPSSPPQTARLFSALGSGDIKETGKIARDKVMARHPLNKRILGDIEKYRKDRKLLSSYLQLDKLWNGRIYYALNPHGTDTGRLAARESSFWCGYQIHNIPRDRKDIQIKSAYIADPGFYLGEADGEQAEARDTAYLSGDLSLIKTVEGTKDYHGVNAERFFGVPYETIVSGDGTVLDTTIRDLSKRTNHGSNYNMGAGVLLDTMGIENVLKARKILRLPNGRTLEAAGVGLKATCQFMLDRYAEAYPTVKGKWYDKCKGDVDSSSMLVGPTGWTRFCFGQPSKNKRDLNRYVAHPPQSLNAMVLNKAWSKVFLEVWLPNRQDFKLLAQIHDSILFQYRIGRRDLPLAVKKCMEISIPVVDASGVKRNLLVPVALKGEATRWSELVSSKKWSPRCQPSEKILATMTTTPTGVS
jgi:DNA polymerase I-like protein with 3'-5' exonuclease and polymerase domains